MAPKKTNNATIKSCDRLTFLRLLKEEFTQTKSLEAKKQTLANLAEDLLRYVLAGLCNLTCDEEIGEYINSFEGSFGGIKACLVSPRIENVLNAITTILFLNTPSSKCRIMG